MSAARPAPTCRTRVCRTAAAALVALFVAGAGVAHAQQANRALAVSVTVVRSAIIEVPTTAQLGLNPTADAAAAVNIRYRAAIGLPSPTVPTAQTLPGAKTTAPVVAPAANGRTLSIQF
jgi:hypothetical protein